MIESQREYARDLLTHVNPYTGNSYANEPAVALIEISNEDGLIREWLWGSLDALPPVYERELARQWNDWLKARYADAAALKAAWNAADRPLSDAELLSNGDFAKGADGWILEQHNGAKATATPATDGPAGRAGAAGHRAAAGAGTLARPIRPAAPQGGGRHDLHADLPGPQRTATYHHRDSRAGARALEGAGLHAGGARPGMAHVQTGLRRPGDGRERARALLGPRPGGRRLRVRGRVIPRGRRHRPPRGAKTSAPSPRCREKEFAGRAPPSSATGSASCGNRGALLDRHAPVHPRGTSLRLARGRHADQLTAPSPSRRRWTSWTGTPTGNTRSFPEGRGTRSTGR